MRLLKNSVVDQLDVQTLKFQARVTPNETPFIQALLNTIYIVYSPSVSFINKWQEFPQVL